LSDLNESVKIKSEILRQNSKFENTYKALQKKLTAIETLSNSETVLPQFNEIITLVPAGAKFTNLSYSLKTLTFSASFPNREVLNTLNQNLKSLKYLKSIAIPSVEKSAGPAPVINALFVLKFI
jgi:Tfp pilus assembly protein PilN